MEQIGTTSSRDQEIYLDAPEVVGPARRRPTRRRSSSNRGSAASRAGSRTTRAAPVGARAAARLVPRDQARLLPALRGRDGAHAPLCRRSRPRCGRVHERHVRPREKEWTVTDHNAHTWVEVTSRASAGSRSTRHPSAASWARATRPSRPTFDIREAAAASAGARISRGPASSSTGRRHSRGARGRHRRGEPAARRRWSRDRAPSVLLLVFFVLGVARRGGHRPQGGAARAALRDAATRAELASACRRDLSRIPGRPGRAGLVERHAERGRRHRRARVPRALAALRRRRGRSALRASGRSRAALGRARRELRRLRRQLRRALSVPERVRGMISLRSLTL